MEEGVKSKLLNSAMTFKGISLQMTRPDTYKQSQKRSLYSRNVGRL